MKITGVVIDGKNKGEKIGFPTINLKISDRHRNDFESGVYAGKVFLNGDSKKAAIFIGPERIILEAYILNFSGSLRGKNVEVEIGKKIREAAVFLSDIELITQIKKDIEKIKDLA